MTIRGGWAWALVIALVLSVGLNLFGAGVAVSLMRVREAASGIDRDVASLRARFPPELRRGLRHALFAEREALREADAGTRALITPPERPGGGLPRRWRKRALP